MADLSGWADGGEKDWRNDKVRASRAKTHVSQHGVRGGVQSGGRLTAERRRVAVQHSGVRTATQ